MSSAIDGKNKISKLIKRRHLLNRITGVTAGLMVGAVALIVALASAANKLASALTISSLSQTSGSVAGGNHVMLTGGDFGKNAKIISAVKNNIGALVLTDDGRLYNWGIKYMVYSDSTPNCDIPNYDPSKAGSDNNCIYNPVDITDLFNGEVVNKIYATSNSFIVLTANNRVFTWGQNYNNVFGDGTNVWSRKPVEITKQFGGDVITSVYCDGGSSIFARGESGNVYVWGNNYYGQLGVPATKTPVNLTRVLRDKNLLTTGDDIVSISGGNNPVIITANHRVLVAGNNNSGQLSDLVAGSGSQNNYTDITKLFGNDEVTYASSSNRGAIAYLTKSGRVLTIGNKNMIGKQAADNQNAPVDITDEFGGNKVEKIWSQGPSFIAKTFNNRFYIWGDQGTMKIIGGNSGQVIATPLDVTSKIEMMGELVTSQVGYELLGLNDGKLTGIGQNEAWMINGYDNTLGNASATKLNSSPVDITPRIPTFRPTVKSIKFGNNEAKFEVKDGKTISAAVPAAAKPGKVDVSIIDNSGKTYTLKNGYEYITEDVSTKTDEHVIPTAPNTGYRH